MTALILYTTSGGNTEYLVNQLKIGFSTTFDKTNIVRVEQMNPLELGNYDFILFATPTYNVGNLPYPFEKFVQKALNQGINLNKIPCQNIVLGYSKYYDVFCGAKKPLEDFAKKINGLQIGETILIDGETFDRGQKWIELGTSLSNNLKSQISNKNITFQNLEVFFNPESIIVVGTSENPSKIGHQIFKNIIEGGYRGNIIGINPNATKSQLYEKPLLKEIEEIDSKIDLAIIAIPAEYVCDSIKKCIKRNILNFVIISAGFKESNDKNGINNQKELEEIIANNPDISILGPNCLGFINVKSSLNASFAKTISKEYLHEPGNIAFISQSGAICTELLDKSNYNGNKYQLVVSIGNKSNIDEADILNYLKTQSEIKVVGAYLETYVEKEKLKDSLENSVPFITLANGQSEASINAITSHTGAFVKKNDFIQLSLEEMDIISVNSLHEMDNTLGFFSKTKKIEENSFTILTNAGGPAVVLTDLLSQKGISLKSISQTCLKKLREEIPMYSGENPIDIIGDATSNRFETSLKILTEELKPQNIIVYITPQSVTDIDQIAKLIVEWNHKYKDLIIPLLMGKDSFENAYTIFNQNQIPFFRNDEHLADTIASYIHKFHLPIKEQKLKLSAVQSEKILDITSTQNLAKVIHLTVPLSEKVLKIEDINSAFNRLKEKGVEKFVLKIDNTVSSHKTDIGGVSKDLLDIPKIEEIYKGWIQIFENKYVPAILQEQITFDLEFFCGIKRDIESNFGTMMIIGMGGIYTNILKDITKFLLPVSPDFLDDAIDKLKISAIINGARGKKPLAKNLLIDELMKLQSLVLSNKSIKEIDVNPILLNTEKAICADIKIYT